MIVGSGETNVERRIRCARGEKIGIRNAAAGCRCGAFDGVYGADRERDEVRRKAVYGASTELWERDGGVMYALRTM